MATERLVSLNAVQLRRGSCDRTVDHRGRDAVVVRHRGCWITRKKVWKLMMELQKTFIFYVGILKHGRLIDDTASTI